MINDSEQLDAFIHDFSELDGLKILVHGGGRKATEIADSLGLEPKMIGGRRVTDEANLEIVTMVYAGLLNKKIVAKLQNSGCNALGLSGADANLIRAHKRIVKDIDYGFAESHTTYGVIGVKVWIYRGESRGIADAAGSDATVRR